jgi:hypothetical protein
MGLDLKSDYKELKNKISATQSYNDLKKEYEDVTKRAGENFDELKEKTSEKLSGLKDKSKKFQKEIKNQFEQLLDIATLTIGSGGGTIGLIKKIVLQTIKKIEPQLSEILFDETIKAIGCDQQQRYTEGQVIYIKVSTLDLLGLLKIDPNDEIGQLLYEKNPINYQDNPFSMNRLLYALTQTPNVSYSFSTGGQLYKGQSGQDLFDIEYTEINPNTSGGPWFKVTLSQRSGGANTIVQFIIDYYKSIKIVEFDNIMSNIMNRLTGAFDFGLNVGGNQIETESKFALLLQRILGLCFDNRREIDVSGVAKIPEDDPIDESFFEFSTIDLRNIENRITNIKNGVVQYEDCGNVLLPLDVDSIVGSLSSLRFVSDDDKVNSASQLTQSLTNNPDWNINIPNLNINLAIDLNFIKLIPQSIVFSILSPKVILPIYTMLLSLGQQIVNSLENIVDFTKKFSKFITNLASKIGSIFVEELFNLIQKDLLQLASRVVLEIQNERKRKISIIILKLIQILLIVGQLISDWRKCKSIVDELLKIMRVGGQLTQGVLGGLTSQVPLPLLFASELLGGYSESRAFIGVIEELQKLGIPTGALPDGSPNLTVLSVFGQLKAMEKEKTENGKVQVAIKPTAVTPAGVTVPNTASGLYF